MSKVSFHPIEYLMSDSAITEIMVNSYNSIFIEKDGYLQETSVCFKNNEELTQYLMQILKNDGKDIQNQFYFDGSLGADYRYNIVLPPMNPKSPSLTLRKFSTKLFTLDTLRNLGSLTDKAQYFLQKIVKGRMNIVVSGGTGTGKTTFLQALSSEIPENERIVSIEDVRELKLHQKNWVQLLALRDGGKNVSIKDCLINSLRMRPDRIIVGECRRDETFEMLQAMNTGHEGSMTTIHANNPVECLTRIENLLHASGYEVDVAFLRRQIANSIDFIIQISRNLRGQRVVSEIIDITGVQADTISRSVIFQLNKQGQLEMTGLVPQKIEQIKAKAGSFPADFFNPGSPFKIVS